MMKRGMDTVQTGEAVDHRTEETTVVGLQALMAEGGKGAARTTAGAGRGAARTMAGAVPELVLIMSVVEAPLTRAKVMQGVAPSMTVNDAKLVPATKGPAG